MVAIVVTRIAVEIRRGPDKGHKDAVAMAKHMNNVLSKAPAQCSQALLLHGCRDGDRHIDGASQGQNLQVFHLKLIQK